MSKNIIKQVSNDNFTLMITSYNENFKHIIEVLIMKNKIESLETNVVKRKKFIKKYKIIKNI